MYNFQFYNPTRLVFGKDSLNELSKLIAPSSRVLLMYGGQSAERNGTLAKVRQILSQCKLHEFSGIQANPDYDQLMPAVTLIRQHNIDFLLAIGGGSVIDGTKFVAAAARYDGDPWEILETYGKHIQAALPVGVVQTFPATSSENNNGSVISRYSIQAKRSFRNPHVFPQFAILDPEISYSLPPQQLANGVVDAFIHVCEQYLTFPVNADVQDRFAESLLTTLKDTGPKALATPENYDVRANLMLACTLCHNGLICSGVPQDWATHKIGHELTAIFGLDHAITLAIVLPALLQMFREQKHAKLLQYAERVWQITTGTEQQRVNAAIERTRAFFEQMGIRTYLQDYGISAAELQAVVDNLERSGMTALGEHKNISLDISRQILLNSVAPD
ncbi:iron-containing alcohol dehydrogenase [Shewanella avicenniae]|uniref:Iron-containing alcohol dehydrogenase n=1 Tax=Shewanella avicenniae TaxID=2814294 RepID=A0ABX7QSJ6_9GAMM|nr:iron-containing alcohol dehydrogenase [Shewanella avicenniae]QSX33900.1 iron-containing alcohol dehydrogenase [Shewanella avicenniae]